MPTASLMSLPFIVEVSFILLKEIIKGERLEEKKKKKMNKPLVSKK
jgi:hypothetical protein